MAGKKGPRAVGEPGKKRGQGGEERPGGMRADFFGGCIGFFRCSLVFVALGSWAQRSGAQGRKTGRAQGGTRYGPRGERGPGGQGGQGGREESPGLHRPNRGLVFSVHS